MSLVLLREVSMALGLAILSAFVVLLFVKPLTTDGMIQEDGEVNPPQLRTLGLRHFFKSFSSSVVTWRNMAATRRVWVSLTVLHRQCTRKIYRSLNGTRKNLEDFLCLCSFMTMHVCGWRLCIATFDLIMVTVSSRLCIATIIYHSK